MFEKKKKGGGKIRHSTDRKRIIPTYGVSRFRDIIPPVSPFTTVPFLFTFSSHTFPLEYPFNRIKFSEEDTRKSGGDLPSTLLDREITRSTSLFVAEYSRFENAKGIIYSCGGSRYRWKIDGDDRELISIPPSWNAEK